jgi:hypothetical protein
VASAQFKKMLISDEPYETTGVFDVNNGGVLEIVAVGKDGLYLYKNMEVCCKILFFYLTKGIGCPRTRSSECTTAKY